MDDSLFYKCRDGLIIKYVKRNEVYNMTSIHFHNSYEIYYLLKGDRCYKIENERYHISPGNLVIINQNQIHQTSITESKDPYHERILLQFDNNMIDSIFPNADFDVLSLIAKHYGILTLNLQEQKQVEHILFDMLKESQNKSIGYQMMIHMRLKELLIFLYRKLNQLSVPLHIMNTTNSTTQKILEVTEYISNNYNNIRSLDDITNQFYLDKSYLCRKFKEVTGYTINDFLNIKRIQQSQILLMNNNLSINDIALMVGFNSASTFIKTYNKYMRISPLKYRKTLADTRKHI